MGFQNICANSKLRLLAILYLFVPVSVASAAPAPISGDTYTYTVCYMKKGDDRTWQWGLNSDNSWYKLNGHWNKTGDTKIQRFVTDVTKADIYASCINSRKYYKRGDYNLDGTYAADSSRGSNYPIFAKDGLLNP